MDHPPREGIAVSSITVQTAHAAREDIRGDKWETAFESGGGIATGAVASVLLDSDRLSDVGRMA